MFDFTTAYQQGAEWRDALCALAASWKAWTQQTGFSDAYFGPVAGILHDILRKLDDAGITQALCENDDFLNARLRHNVIPRLISAIEAFLTQVR